MEKAPEIKGNAGAGALGIALLLIMLGIIPVIYGEMWGFIFIGIGIIFIIIAIMNWGKPNSFDLYFHKKRLEKEELRKAQLQALRKGRTNVEIKGKMRKLK